MASIRPETASRPHSPRRGTRTPRHTALAAALALAATLAQAETYSFIGTGVVTPTAPPDGSLQQLLAVSASGYSLGDVAGWGLYAPFVFDAIGGVGVGTFNINRDGDGIGGTLSTAVLSASSFELTYSVAFGSGRFAGASGIGSTVVSLTGSDGGSGFTYTETGSFDLTLAPVPEPATWALMAAGATLLLRRRLASHDQP